MQAERTEQIRQQIRSALIDAGAAADSGIRETILIRDGHYCGRRFESDGFQAIWFIEEDEVKYFGPDGDLLHRTQMSPAVQRQAA